MYETRIEEDGAQEGKNRKIILVWLTLSLQPVLGGVVASDMDGNDVWNQVFDARH